MEEHFIRYPNPICFQCFCELEFRKAENSTILIYRCPDCGSVFELKLNCRSFIYKRPERPKQLSVYSKEKIKVKELPKTACQEC